MSRSMQLKMSLIPASVMRASGLDKEGQSLAQMLTYLKALLLDDPPQLLPLESNDVYVVLPSRKSDARDASQGSQSPQKVPWKIQSLAPLVLFRLMGA